MNKLNKFSRATIAIAMMLCVALPTFAYDIVKGGIYYKITNSTNKTVAVTYRGSYYESFTDEYTGAVTIPSSVTYNSTTYSVTSIGDEAFRGCTGLTSITIPNSVTSIGLEAFEGCTGLTSVTIGNSVTSIGNSAFYGCTGLTSITIPNSVTSIGNSAFYGCTGLTSITIPNSVTSIGSYAFRECTGLTSVTIPNSVTSIGSYAFCNCTGLTSVNFNAENCTSMGSYAYPVFNGCTKLKTLNIGNSVKTIPNSAFYNCTGLTSITIPNSVTTIGGNAFEYCTGLTSITIPNSVTTIGYDAFAYCTRLTSVTIGNSVTSIGDNAFEYCTGLTSITIPNSVTSIGDGAFYGCSNLKFICNLSKLTLSKGSSSYGYLAYYASYVINAPNGFIDGDFVWNIADNINTLIAYCGNASKLILPIDFNGDIYKIGSYAFYGCTGLSSVTIPNSVTSIGSYAFIECTGLTSVTIPNSVTSIGYDAFYDCTGLTSVTIGNSVTSIGNSAFDGCFGLTEVNITDLSAWCKIDFGSSEANPLYFANKLKLNGSEIKDLVIPNDITEIKDDAFSRCHGLTSVTIPNSVTSIGSDAFRDCTGLTSVTIPNSVTSIGGNAFRGCTGLTSVTIPNSVTSIGEDAFSGCTGLTEVTIPNSVTTISDYAFYGCTGLTSVTIPNSVTSIGEDAFSGCTGLTSVTIPNSVTSIGEDAFYDCTGLTEVNFNAENCTSMGSSSYPVFSGCSNLKTINIGNNVKTIPANAFRSCTGLTSITIPNSVTLICDNAFSGCTGLTELFIADGTAPISGLSFPSSPITTLYLGRNTSEVFMKKQTSLKKLTIGNSVTSIGSSAFSNCSGLTELIIADGATSISGLSFPNSPITTLYLGRNTSEAFMKNKTSLKVLTIGNSVTMIGDEAFSGCSGLTSITIPNSVTTISDYAFYGCTGLTSVTIPNSVTSIGEDAFSGCTGLTSITIPNSVTTISDYAFYGCTGLTSVTIPNSVTSIGGNAFRGCTGLTSVTIPNSVTTISDYAFYGCTGLTSVTIPNSVTSIGGNAFSNCSGLTELIIADGATSISGLSFPSSPITTLYLGRNTSEVFMKKQTSLKKLTIGNSVTSICDNAFSGCTGLTEVNFNAENCTSMGSSSYPVFSGCSNLKTLNIGNYVKTIPNYAFYGCTGLTEVTIPSSVTSIGDKAFWGCNKLISSEIIDKTQTTVSIALATPTKYQTGITTNENEKIISESNNIFIKGLKPNTKYTYNSSLIFNDIFCDINSFSFTTNNLVIKNTDIIGVTSASSKAYCEGDVSVIECGINWGNSSVEYNNLDSISAYNLDPNTTYYVYYFLNTKEGGEYSTSWSIRTKILSWNAGEFTATSTTSARLSVETNCDATEGTGYEWIRYDAPDNLTPNKAPCPIVNGMLRGSLRGLNPNVYYKCRPYYTSSSGKTHYGAWFTIFTGDANVYFDPEVSTYDNTVVDNTAIINGYALAGSDDILEQGFEYWNASATPSAEGSMGIMTVKASGISMSATIANLNYNSTYRYRAFAKTANGIFYGSEKEFTTSNDPLGIEGVEVDDNAVEVARYDIHGRLLSKPARGFNIVIYSDGTTRKEIVK